MIIGIACDHRGFRLKEKIVTYLTNLDYEVIDFGTTSKESVDYPTFAFTLGEAIVDKAIDMGIAICGTGIGISIACNKVKGVRCAKVDRVKEAIWSRKDNDANVLAISGEMSSFRAKNIVDAFLKTPFSHLERHQRRIDMIKTYEEERKGK